MLYLQGSQVIQLPIQLAHSQLDQLDHPHWLAWRCRGGQAWDGGVVAVSAPQEHCPGRQAQLGRVGAVSAPQAVSGPPAGIPIYFP